MELENSKSIKKCLKMRWYLIGLQVSKWRFWVSFLLILGAIRYQKNRILALDEKCPKPDRHSLSDASTSGSGTRFHLCSSVKYLKI